MKVKEDKTGKLNVPMFTTNSCHGDWENTAYGTVRYWYIYIP